MTLVETEAELELPTTDKYEPLAILSHRGATLAAGHYVTYAKTEAGQWLLFNDANIQPSSLEQANTPDNYILLFRKMEDGIGAGV